MRICPHCRAALDESDADCPGCGADLRGVALRPDDPLIGRTLAAKYLLEEAIGVGATGRVYRARNVRSGGDVALKLLSADEASDPMLGTRFQQEARAMSRLRHPHNLAVLDFGQTDEGHLFLVTEFLRGRTLATVIRDEAPLEPRRAVLLLAQALDGLAEAHAAGIVHRDFKPSNLFVVTGRGGVEQVKVIDYGIAKVQGDVDPAGGAPGPVAGTPDYMAPEQIRGEALDGRTDLYAAGVVLYEMLVGSRPFTGSMLNVLTLHLHHPPEPPRLRRIDLPIPAALERVCLRALQKRRGDRVPSALRMREELLASVPAGVEASEAQAAGGDGPRWPLPFVGRDEALERLVRLKRHALLVVGAPGSGRTRLVEEWRRKLQEGGERVVVMRADPSGARASWAPVRRAVAAVLGIAERPALEALEAACVERPSDRLGVREVFGFGGACSDDERPFRRREALASTAGLLREAGVALACEDVDRYDRPSVEVVQSLMLDAGVSRVVVTSTGRGDLPEVETLTLAPLGEAELRALGVGAPAPDLPGLPGLPDLGDLAGGPITPLALEQALRAQIEGAPDATAAGRLDSLLPAARRVLAAAVVAGTEVDAALLSQATAVADVLAPLSSLASRGLARYEGGRVVLPSPTLRDALYAAIADEERRALHRTFAGLLVAHDEDPTIIAHHVTAAAAAAEAIPLEPLAAAMRACARGFDDPGAVRWGARALKRARAERTLPGVTPPRVVVALELGEALLRMGNAAHAEPAFKEALAGAGPDLLSGARARRGLARVLGMGGQLEAAEAELARAIELSDGDSAFSGELHLELASLRDRQDRGHDAETALIQGAVKAPAAPGVTWRLLLALAEHNHAAGRPEDARQLAEQALQAVHDGAPVATGRILGLLSVVEQGLGDLAAAAQHRRAALEALRRLGDRRSTAELLLGSALSEASDEPTPRRWLAEAGELARQVGWLEGMARAQEALRALG